MKRLLALVIALGFLAVMAGPTWAELVTKVDKPKPAPQGGGNSGVVDLRGTKSQVPHIPPTPPPVKQEKQAPKK